MCRVLLAVFDEYKVAEHVRVELLRDGFPTDRVELTACCEPGRAGLEPADSLHGRFVQYFRMLFTFENEEGHAEQLAQRLDDGAAIITVHPRGSMEVRRATQIFVNAHAVELLSHDLSDRPARCAVIRRARPWIFGGPALCLLFAGYLMAKQAFPQIGLRVPPSESGLQQEEAVLDETAFPHQGYSASSFISSVIAHYFDTYLAGDLEPLQLARLSHRPRLDAPDSGWGTLGHGASGNAPSCFGAAFCDSYDTELGPWSMSYGISQ